MKETFMPQINLISEHSDNNRHVAFVEFKERRPSDNQLILWASKHFPNLHLVDAFPKN